MIKPTHVAKVTRVHAAGHTAYWVISVFTSTSFWYACFCGGMSVISAFLIYYCPKGEQ